MAHFNSNDPNLLEKIEKSIASLMKKKTEEMLGSEDKHRMSVKVNGETITDFEGDFSVGWVKCPTFTSNYLKIRRYRRLHNERESKYRQSKSFKKGKGNYSKTGCF
eukprot:s2435_g19.t1